ncbi:hypothetical protein ASG89_21660 [Paenibacillus sp. Soil766]|nr:hypothetical protein ASG89_21660 [Paenibacillus sp. Soil766]
MKSRIVKKQLWTKRKIAVGIVSLTVVISATTGISYADTDLAGAMTSWFAKKTDQVMQSLDKSMQTEIAAQKELLKKELQQRLEASSLSLETYAGEQKQIRLDTLSAYAQQLLSQMDIHSGQDREQLVRKLQEIVISAQAAMEDLTNSYVPPALVFIDPLVIKTPSPITVVSDVYGQPPLPESTTVTEVTYQ